MSTPENSKSYGTRRTFWWRLDALPGAGAVLALLRYRDWHHPDHRPVSAPGVDGLCSNRAKGVRCARSRLLCWLRVVQHSATSRHPELGQEPRGPRHRDEVTGRERRAYELV